MDALAIIFALMGIAFLLFDLKAIVRNRLDKIIELLEKGKGE
jgi:hypothetical protein